MHSRLFHALNQENKFPEEQLPYPHCTYLHHRFRFHHHHFLWKISSFFASSACFSSPYCPHVFVELVYIHEGADRPLYEITAGTFSQGPQALVPRTIPQDFVEFIDSLFCRKHYKLCAIILGALGLDTSP